MAEEETKKRGKFIAFEGLDGSGMSTQAMYLENYLRAKGFQTLLTKEPTTGILGGIIKSTLRGELHLAHRALQLLFCADRAQHLATEVEPALADGKIVITDRYLFSTLAYGYASNVDYDYLLDLNRKFILPDLVIFLDVDPVVSLERISKGRFSSELFEKKESLTKVRQAYLKLGKEFKFKVINGEDTIQKVGENIVAAVESVLQEQQNRH